MIKFMRSAVVVVACVAGFGALGAKVEVTNGKTMYASELFGPGHSSPAYPDKKTPMVVMKIPVNRAKRDAVTTGAEADRRDACPADNHDGEVEVTFTLSGGAQFASAVGPLLFDPISGNTGNESARKTASGSVATIKEGGGKGDSSITIVIKAADTTVTEAPNNNHSTRTTHTVTANDAYTNAKACTLQTTAKVMQEIAFELPRLQNLGALAGAAPTKSITISANSRLVSGAFTQGNLVGSKAPSVVMSRDSLTLMISDPNTRTIAIDDDAGKGLMAFKSVKEKNKDGYVHLATVTITTKQPDKAEVPAQSQKVVYHVDTTIATDDPADGTAGNPWDRNQVIFTPSSTKKDATFHTVYDLDGKEIDEGLRGTFSVNAMGTRDLFNDGDMLFVDYDGNGKMGSGENIAIDGAMATGDALSIDPDKSDSFNEGGTGMFNVYYMPGGKENINHGAMINLTAMVDYSDPSAIDEADKKTSTTLNFDGVGTPIRAYAIPHSTNGTGDKGNVRVRCEKSSGDCRVFLECWDDMGMRGFGEAPKIAGNNLAKWTSADIEGVTMLEPSSRLSCRVLSRGKVTVQQLTRDGNSGTLVNNTFVGGDYMGMRDGMGMMKK